MYIITIEKLESPDDCSFITWKFMPVYDNAFRVRATNFHIRRAVILKFNPLQYFSFQNQFYREIQSYILG